MQNRAYSVRESIKGDSREVGRGLGDWMTSYGIRCIKIKRVDIIYERKVHKV